MVLILLSWLYIIFTASSLGIGFSKLLGIRSQNLLITNLFGLFTTTLLASIWAVFGPLNLAFNIFLFTTTIVTRYVVRADWQLLWQKTLASFWSFSTVLKILFISSSLLVLAQSAAAPFIVDNETYYLQTIKWLNQYGFVPGLANLHLFFGQTSGWHIVQSAFSFSFLYENFNDLNGLILVLVNFWSFDKLHSFFKFNSRMDLVFGLLPVSYLLLLQFVNAPSPDLPIYLLAFTVFSIYTESRENVVEKFKLLVVLTLFAVYIKITALVLIIFPVLLLVKHFSQLKKTLFPISLLSFLVFLIFTVKNIILTGYPLFPLALFRYSNADYAVPNEIMTYFFGRDMMHSFYLPFGTFENASMIDMAKHYFGLSNMNGIIGLTTLLLLVITPFIIAKFFSQKSLQQIYLVFVILVILLIFSSPQYRFYLYFTIFFGLLWLAVMLSNKNLILSLVSLSLIFCAVIVFIPMTYRSLTHNSLLHTKPAFQLKNLVEPNSNSQYYLVFSKETKGNLYYLSPPNTALFWITGNGNLPTVNKEQLQYFETYFHVIPQCRGKSLDAGFYAKTVKSYDKN